MIAERYAYYLHIKAIENVISRGHTEGNKTHEYMIKRYHNRCT